MGVIFYSFNTHRMIMRVFILAIAAIAIMVKMAAVITGLANIAISTSDQNATRWNKTSGNSTEGLTTSKEPGAYSDYGG